MIVSKLTPCSILGYCRPYSVAVALGVFASIAEAQRTPSDSATFLNVQAYAAFNEGTTDGLERARSLWQHTFALARAAGNRTAEADALRGFGLLHYRQSRPDSALAFFRQELPVRSELRDPEQLGFAFNALGVTHYAMGSADSALVAYRHAAAAYRQAGSPAREAIALQNIGGLLSDSGQPDSALVYFRAALPVLREAEDDRPAIMALTNMGRAHRALGQLDSAMASYAEAHRLQREVTDRETEGFILSNMGSIQLDLGRPDSALVYYHLALESNRSVENRDREAGALALIGLVHFQRGSPDSALSYYHGALRIVEEISDKNQQGRILNNIGEVHGVLNRPDSALMYFDRALGFRREARDVPGVAITLSNIATTRILLGDLDAAASSYAAALDINREIGNRLREAQVLGFLADLWYRNRLEPSTAVAYYDSAAAVLAAVATSTGGDLDRLSFAEQDATLFANWTLAWLARTRELGREASAYAALAAAERGRAQALLELLRAGRSRSNDAGGVRVEPSLAGLDLVEEGRALARATVPAGAAALSYLVTTDTLVTWLLLPERGVHVVARPIARDTLVALVSAVRAGIAAAGATPGGLPLRVVDALESETTAGTSAGIGIGPAPDAAAARLAELLLPAELIAQLPAGGGLLVIPQGALAPLPFAALPVEDGNQTLGLRYALRYAPSLATLRLVEARAGILSRRPAAFRGTVVVGDPQMPRVRSAWGEVVSLEALPGARLESGWVARLLVADELNGEAATETAVRNRLHTAPIVHLATHGFAYSAEARTRDSFVALAADSLNDGLLTVGEVLDDTPPLSAELVVLSACQTGLGNLKQAEGTVGFQRAFLARGARTVLVSLWSVSDAATEALMRGFYMHWLGDADAPDKAEALRRAQQDVRRMRGWEHPRYWAAFQLVGAG